jgi:hypothetical protein
MKNKKLRDEMSQTNANKCPALFDEISQIYGNHQYELLSSTQSNDEFLPQIHCYTISVCKYCGNIQNEHQVLDYGLTYLLSENEDIEIINPEGESNA